MILHAFYIYLSQLRAMMTKTMCDEDGDDDDDDVDGDDETIGNDLTGWWMDGKLVNEWMGGWMNEWMNWRMDYHFDWLGRFTVFLLFVKRC